MKGHNMLVCHKLSDRDEEFDMVIDMIFELEKTFMLCDKTRKALFEARGSVNTAKFLNRQAEEWAEKLKKEELQDSGHE